jgi:hypothetical protein
MEAALTEEVESEATLVFDFDAVDALLVAGFGCDARERLGGGVGVLRRGREGVEQRNGARGLGATLLGLRQCRERKGGGVHGTRGE